MIGIEINTLSNKKLIMKYPKLQDYGVKRGDTIHKGIDYNNTVTNQIITATTDMTIEYIGWDSKLAYKGGFGYYIRGRDKKGYYHYFGHLKANSSLLGKDISVKKGTPLAIMGSTGNSTGIHVHYEVRKKRLSSAYIDPRPYLIIKKPPMNEDIKNIQKRLKKWMDLKGDLESIRDSIDNLKEENPKKKSLMVYRTGIQSLIWLLRPIQKVYNIVWSIE